MTDYEKLKSEHGHKTRKRSRSAKKGAKSVKAEPWLYATKEEQHAQVVAMSSTHNQSAVAKHVGIPATTVRRWVARHEALVEQVLRDITSE
jgi:hypothetical protein